jgi:hypothetical protein
MTYYILTDIAGKHGLVEGRRIGWATLGRKGTLVPEHVQRFRTKKEAAAKAKALKAKDCHAKVEKRQTVLVAFRSEDCRETQLAEFPTERAAKSFCRTLRGTTWEWAIEVPKKA